MQNDSECYDFMKYCVPSGYIGATYPLVYVLNICRLFSVSDLSIHLKKAAQNHAYSHEKKKQK